jgi:hypothetical protein
MANKGNDILDTVLTAPPAGGMIAGHAEAGH